MKKLALNGGSPVRARPFPAWPVVGSEERERLLSVFDSGKWWYGEQVSGFEKEFAGFHDAKYGISCTNGTAALELCLAACGIGGGDEVIVPPYTFFATASSVMRANAVPVFADIRLDTCNLDPEDVERKITCRTKAVIPVHFGGLPVDMDAFNSLAEKYNLKIIEDACHSWGSKWKGKGTGALGNCGAFSFQMSKNITAGEGGIVLTDDKALADTARSYSNVGRMEGKVFYEHYLAGGNLRMTELQAAILLGQFSRLKDQTLKRDVNATYLSQKLKDIRGISLIKRDPRVTPVRGYHMYIFRYLEEEWSGISREKFLKSLNAEGIPANSGYPIPLYKNPVFLKKQTASGSRLEYEKTDYEKTVCPNAEKICKEACWIPHAVLLAETKDMQDIADAVSKIRERLEELKEYENSR